MHAHFRLETKWHIAYFHFISCMRLRLSGFVVYKDAFQFTWCLPLESRVFRSPCWFPAAGWRNLLHSHDPAKHVHYTRQWSRNCRRFTFHFVIWVSLQVLLLQPTACLLSGVLPCRNDTYSFRVTFTEKVLRQGACGYFFGSLRPMLVFLVLVALVISISRVSLRCTWQAKSTSRRRLTHDYLFHSQDVFSLLLGSHFVQSSRGGASSCRGDV